MPQAGGPAAPLGRLVSVGYHRLHLYCTGHGSPTIVLEAGIGGNHLDLIRIQPGLSKTTRVCSYDRAGYGWSGPGPKPRTASRIAGELELLLRNARIDGPIVLVGHSFGGALSLYYAGRHLVRGTHQGQRAGVPHQQAGHMLALDQAARTDQNLANRGSRSAGLTSATITRPSSDAYFTDT